MQYEEILHRCFRCGYCKLPGNYVDFNCPPYQAFRFESYSPGGRMWLIRAWLEHKIGLTGRLQEIIFSCVSCGNCVEHCTFPKFKDQLLLAFTAAKAELVNAGKVPPAVRDCLTKVYQYGNGYGLAPKKRTNWTQSIEMEQFSDQEYLFYVGDVGSFDSRGQEIARSVALLMSELGISFGILGAKELADGNEVKSMGEMELFKYLAQQNIKTFEALGVQKIITLSPHGFNAFKNDYPGLGGRYQVYHYTQILAPLIKDAPFTSDLPPVRVTYHDSCYLGRHNREYGSARNMLAAVSGLQLVEMDRSFQNALCCGGGGGNIFTGIIGGGADNSARARIREAAGTGAQVLGVACPQCAVMLEDALKVENLEGEIAVKEVSEIVRERLISK
jgi:Fe-S oxidoreductase